MPDTSDPIVAASTPAAAPPQPPAAAAPPPVDTASEPNAPPDPTRVVAPHNDNAPDDPTRVTAPHDQNAPHDATRVTLEQQEAEAAAKAATETKTIDVDDDDEPGSPDELDAHDMKAISDAASAFIKKAIDEKRLTVDEMEAVSTVWLTVKLASKRINFTLDKGQLLAGISDSEHHNASVMTVIAGGKG